jgi:hypothetical protein
MITSKLHSIIQNYIIDKTNANTRIEKLGNVQQMVLQIIVYLVFSLPLCHSFWTFQFIDTSPFKECVFMLKNHKQY